MYMQQYQAKTKSIKQVNVIYRSTPTEESLRPLPKVATRENARQLCAKLRQRDARMTPVKCGTVWTVKPVGKTLTLKK